MNSDYRQRLETEVDRELKGLPELTAPGTLTARVMARIEKRSALPWHRQAWPAWPRTARTLSLVAMLVLFGGICFTNWRFFQGAEAGLAAQKMAGWFSGLAVIWNALGAVGGAAILAIKKLGTGFLIVCLAVAVFNYFTCVGLGTVAVRFALSRIRRNQL
jgi:hypothetical protein